MSNELNSNKSVLHSCCSKRTLITLGEEKREEEEIILSSNRLMFVETLGEGQESLKLNYCV